MKTLKDKLDLYYTTGLYISTIKIREDVKEHILEFESEYIKLYHSGELNLFNLVELRRKIFGNFEK